MNSGVLNRWPYIKYNVLARPERLGAPTRIAIPGPYPVSWIASPSNHPRLRRFGLPNGSVRARWRAGRRALEIPLQPAPASVRDFGWNHPAYRSFATIDRRALNRFFELGVEVRIRAEGAIE